jgi:hypothetical protein
VRFRGGRVGEGLLPVHLCTQGTVVAPDLSISTAGKAGARSSSLASNAGKEDKAGKAGRNW